MPVPQTAMLDDFNRANEGPPPSANWTTFTSAAGGLTVSSNQLAATSGDGAAYWNAEDFGPDAECYAHIPAITTSDEAWLYARLNDIGSGTNDGYVFQLILFADLLNDADLVLYLHRLDNDVLTQLGIEVHANNTYLTDMALRIEGSTLTMVILGDGDFAGWTDLYSTSDSTYTASGKLALRLKDASGTLRADDFGGGRVLDLSTERIGGVVVVGP